MLLPNQLTLLRIILTPVFLVLFLAEDPLLKQISLIVFLIAAITDWYDGWLARKFNYITNWGKFMDPLADKILISTAFFAFVFNGTIELWMTIVIVARDFFVTGLRMYADYKGDNMTTSNFAKWKTAIQMIYIYYLLFIYTATTIGWLYKGNEDIFSKLMHPAIIYYGMLAVTIITTLTGITYVHSNRRLIKKFFTNEAK
jgi:CDP-diacylglycerol--glycerol-3-phosphate 3-phosphatidyltransferase